MKIYFKAAPWKRKKRVRSTVRDYRQTEHMYKGYRDRKTTNNKNGAHRLLSGSQPSFFEGRETRKEGNRSFKLGERGGRDRTLESCCLRTVCYWSQTMQQSMGTSREESQSYSHRRIIRRAELSIKIIKKSRI